MTKTYRYDARRDAQNAWPIDKGTWFDGHDIGNLWKVEKSEVFNDAGSSMWAVEVTFRPATPGEFGPARLRWLQAERSRVLSTCYFGNPEPGRLGLESRASLKQIDGQIAELTAPKA